MRSIFSISFLVVLLVGCGGSGGQSDIQAPANILHTLSASPVTVATEDKPYQFSVSVNNPDGDRLSFSLVNAPAWLSINDNGLVSGIAKTDAETGTFENIIVRVTDSKQQSVELAPFNLAVKAIDDLPEVSFDKRRYSVDGRSTRSISFTFNDEESAIPIYVQSMGANSDLFSIEYSGNNTIEIRSKDVNTVRSETIQFEFSDGANTVTASTELTLFPMSESGFGRTIRGSRSGSGLHLVVLGDGYLSTDQELFLQDVIHFNQLFDNDPYIASHMSAWNIHAVFTSSEQSGADEVYGKNTSNTFFESGYNCADIKRLICANKSKVFEVALREYPFLDQTVLIVNDEEYGGSGGGALAIFSRSFPEIAMHELGHSFANLADEYVDEAIAHVYTKTYKQGNYANISNSNNIEDAPWAHWVEDRSNVATEDGSNAVGMYEGAFYNGKGFYRPVYDSVMRTITSPFGVVNAEQWILSIYTSVGAVTDVFPFNSNVIVNANEGATFSVEPTFGAPLQEIRWFIDDIEISGTLNSSTIALDLPVGNYEVTMKIKDVSGRIRNPSKEISANFSNQWQLSVR